MRKLIIITILLLFSYTAWATSTFTPNLGMNQPGYNDSDWHTPLNNNATSLDVAVGAQHTKEGYHNTITGEALVLSSDTDIVVVADKFHVSGDNASSGDWAFRTGFPNQSDAFQILRNTEVSGDVVIKIGDAYIWVVTGDATADLRIHIANPTSSDSGRKFGF